MRSLACRRILLAATFLAIALPSGAAISIEAPDSLGKVRKIVRPDYPAAALGRGANATIDVEGVVDGTGSLRDVRYRAVAGDAAAFMPALQAVVPYWEFNPPLGDDCLPTSERVQTRVEFEVDAGKPRIFVTPGARGSARTGAKPTYMLAPAYPRAMEVTGAEAKVYTRATVDGSGRVADVSAKVYPLPTVTVSSTVDWAHFTDETSRTLRHWSYPAGTSGRVVCQVFSFRLPR
jgi:hypothetical protein